MLIQMAIEIEENWVHLDVPSDPMKNAMHEWKHRGDPTLRRALTIQNIAQRNTARTAGRICKIAKSVGRDMGNMKPYHTDFEAYRYWLATRQAFDGAVHVGLAVDGTRIGKRNRLAGVAMNLDSGITAWPPPQVGRGTKTWS